MGKIDIKSAYRLIPVREQDWPLLGYQIDGKFYHNVVLPLGCRSSPFLFSRFADAIHWIVGNQTGRDTYLHYVDHFFFVGTAGSKECSQLMAAMRDTCGELEVPLSDEKEDGPAPQLTFLGVLLDAVRQTISLPKDKQQEITSLLREWEVKETFSKRELQSLIGSLQFASKCIPSSRLFTRRLIRSLPSTNSLAAVSENIRKELKWWQHFLPS